MTSIPPDVLVLGGPVHAVVGREPVSALLLRGGRVIVAGSEAEARAAARPGARTEPLDGATVTPGLVDAHIHPVSWALARRRVDLSGAPSLDAGLRLLAGAASGDGWLRGGGWSMQRWGGFPGRGALDAAVPERPAVLDSADLHAFWVNSRALERCGIGRDTPDPPGGRIARDAAGEPTGVLLEHAKRLVEPHLPEPDSAEVDGALRDAQAQLHRWGVTGMHSVEADGLGTLSRFHEEGKLRLRVLQTIPLPRLAAATEVGLRSGFGGDFLRIGGVKMFLDGTLGSRTALLREPYEGFDRDCGTELLAPADFREAVESAAAAGLAATVHAIGDAAVARALETLAAVPPPPALPHRIEHLQLCPPELWDAAAAAGIVASMQPVHLRTDIRPAGEAWGSERARGAYAFAPLARAGTTLAFGSDAPVETPDPREGCFAAVRRIPRDQPSAAEWFPENALSAAEALRAYTEGPARAAGLAGRTGKLLPGCDADLVAWDRDPLGCPPEELLEMRCLLTLVAGEAVYREGD